MAQSSSSAQNRQAAAREFVRSLNLVLKSSRLYGLENERCAGLLEAAWHALSAALTSGGEGGLLLGVAGGRLLVDGTAIDTAPSDRGFVEILAAGRLASLQFGRRTRKDDMLLMVRALTLAANRPGELAVSLRNALGHPATAHIRVNIAPVVAVAGIPRATGTVAAPLSAAAGPPANDWLQDPRRLLELVSVAELGATHDAGVPEPVAGATEWLALMATLRQLGEFTASGGVADPLALKKLLSDVPRAAHACLRDALTELCRASAISSEPHLFVQLAEGVALSLTHRTAQNAVPAAPQVLASLDFMAADIEALQMSLPMAAPAAPAGSGPRPEPHGEILHRHFWSALPEGQLRHLLLSPQAWCVPPRQLLACVEQMLDRSDVESAGAVLFSYASAVHSPEPAGRRSAAAGLAELARFYAARGSRFLDFAIYHVGEQLGAETEADIQNPLATALLRLSQEAASRRDYPSVQQVLAKLASVQLDQPALAERLRPRIGVESRIHDFLDEYLRTPASGSGLAGVLQRVPAAAAVELAQRFNRCARRDECERVIALARESGEDCLQHLRQTLRSGSEPAAVATVGLLSRLDAALVERELPERLRQWHQAHHDSLIRQLALGGAGGRGQMLVNWFGLLDPMVLPEAVDEVGLCGDPATASHLLSLAAGERPEFASPYLRIKTVEALGRMRETRAIPLLRELAEGRGRWMWTHPRELRVVAAQALTRIDPDWGKNFLPSSGLSTEDFSSGPLDAASSADWARARRYPRVQLRDSLSAVASSPRSRSNLGIQVLNLGGGLATTDGKLSPGSEATIELRSGIRPIRAQVLLREARRDEVSFEIARMDFDGRHRLRRLLDALPAK